MRSDRQLVLTDCQRFFRFVQLIVHNQFFFLKASAATKIYTLSLHDALPIFVGFCYAKLGHSFLSSWTVPVWAQRRDYGVADRKSTRLNSSHANISYAVFCLKKKKK